MKKPKREVRSPASDLSAALRGECIVCGCAITEADYDRQAVVSAIGPEGTIVCCVSHLTDDGPTGPQFLRAVQLIAEAKVRQLSSSDKANPSPANK